MDIVRVGDIKMRDRGRRKKRVNELEGENYKRDEQR